VKIINVLITGVLGVAGVNVIVPNSLGAQHDEA
jgi:hypothetical protein